MAVTSFILLLALVAAGATITDYFGRLLEKRERVHLDIDDKKSHDSKFTESKQVPRFENKAKKLFLCFSLLENGTKLFGRESSKTDSIGVLHGLRFFCIAWVICIHNRIIPRYTNVFRNSADMNKVNLMTTIIDRGPLAVDTFFFIGESDRNKISGLTVACERVRQPGVFRYSRGGLTSDPAVTRVARRVPGLRPGIHPMRQPLQSHHCDSS
ncbi:uncharacterized protein LOC125943601 [Dermacentor silvarum]|uniref:uncharacterized protein LOC125943601 n=1 Tax=Dermacentor silvarum TaxID=543639 RepID=UPI0021006F58|nr:uncharacterized protein LOC125943601 [Dermacentor silvarum]